MAGTCQGDLVAVLEELALEAGADGDRFGTAPAELEHGTVGVLGRPADGARAEQVAGVEVAAGDRVVRQLLLHRPVHPLEVGTRHRHRLGAVVSCQLQTGFNVQTSTRLSQTLTRWSILTEDFHVEVDVEVEVVVVAQVGQRLRLLRVVGDAERLQRLHRYHPRRHGRRKVLGQERTQRHVLPLLNVARCRPTIVTTTKNTKTNKQKFRVRQLEKNRPQKLDGKGMKTRPKTAIEPKSSTCNKPVSKLKD